MLIVIDVTEKGSNECTLSIRVKSLATDFEKLCAKTFEENIVLSLGPVGTCKQIDQDEE
jgi:hypothetical protein